MPITDPYADTDTYQLVTGDTISDDTTLAQVASSLLASSRWIDRHCGRHFNRDPEDAPTVRIYRTRAFYGSLPVNWAESENPYRYGGWTRQLSTEDMVSVTSIIIDSDLDGSFADESALSSTDYELQPNNAASGPEPKPYTAIYLPPNSNTFGFRPGAKIQVTAVHGWPAVPETIVRLTCEHTQLRRNAFNRGLSGVRSMAVAGGPSISYGDAGAKLPESFLADLRPYVREASIL